MNKKSVAQNYTFLAIMLGAMILGALFGSITPFCSCSGIPLFLGFAAARIPMGITMSFLITSPLINELAVALLWRWYFPRLRAQLPI